MPAQDGRTFECDKLIRFHHCDPAGIVFYPQYFVLFNELVEDWFNQALGIDFADFHVNQHLGVPMGSVECRFVSPSKVGEMLRLSLRVERLGTSSMKFAVQAQAGGQLRVEAKLTVVLACMKTHRSVPITGELRDKFSAYLIGPVPLTE
ncbi:MAG: acyl-CoA thioesterase [Rhodoferax sp.]|nr:acyl-CoA thioesterase [Rhodoferax sp.]MBK9236869.1 acyl-CoA thioesterase [Rhodoferax sp.]